MQVVSNLDLESPQVMVQALRDHFKGVSNKEYIKQSLDMHLHRGLITEDQHAQMFGEYDLQRTLCEPF